MSNRPPTSISAYIFDLTRIVEGALGGEPNKVIAYASQLSDRLEADGEAEAAKRLRAATGGAELRTVGLAKAGAKPIPSPPSPIPVDGDSRLPIADEHSFRRGEVLLVVPNDVQEAVRRFLAFLRESRRLAEHGVSPDASMLLFGPPGCGKTQLARYIASELELPLITARTDALISSYLGDTAKNLRLLFEHAASRPCVLFLDELDALAKMRDDGHELGELKRVVISLLQNIDALGPEHVLIGATNHEHLLDRAVWRRFTQRICLDPPDYPARVQLLGHFLGPFADADIAELLANITDGISGAGLRSLAQDAIRQAIIAHQEKIDTLQAVRHVLALRHGGRTTVARPTSPAQEVREVRQLAPRYFTQTRLAALFGMAQSTVSRMLAEDDHAE